VLADWLDRHTSLAPAALSARVRERALAVTPRHTVAGTLARAAGETLEHVLARPGDRAVALDLLAADALVTLALLAQAELAPAHLGEFAASLLRPGRASL
jgi:hypothetical protein